MAEMTQEERERRIRTNKKIFKIFGVIFVCIMLAGMFISNNEKDKKINVQPVQQQAGAQTSTPQISAQEASVANKLFQEPTEAEKPASKEARVRIGQRAPVAQAEIKKLYDELLAMRGTSEFRDLGFSGKNKTSNEWRSRVNELSVRLKADDDIPINIKVAPGYLITLGMEKAWREGRTTDDSKWNLQMVQDALNWKLEE